MTSNIHIRRAEHQRQQRRVRQYMSLTDAKWRQLRADRDQEAGLMQQVERELRRLEQELRDASQRGDWKQAGELAARIKGAGKLIEQARATIGQHEQGMRQASTGSGRATWSSGIRSR